MIRYLGSTKNLAGCLAGFVGVVLYLVGVVGGGYWLFVVAALYAAGALLAPPDRVHLVSDDSAELRTELATLLSKLDEHHARMPETATDRVRRIGEALGGMLDRPAALAANPDLRHAMTRLVRVDLPMSVETYLNLPWWFAAKRRAGGEPSAGEQLLAQLELLELESHRIAERFYAADVNQQDDQLRYLRERDGET